MVKSRRLRPRLPLIDRLAIAVVSAVVVVVTWLVMSSPSFMVAGTIVTHVETSEKIVALTLDDGPLPVHTEETLKLLAASEVKATFFVIGKDAAAHPDELKAIVAAGHTLGNHSYTHRMLAFLSPGTVRQEIEATDAVLRSAGYDGAIPFRAPYNVKFFALPLYLQAHERPDISRDVITEEGTARSAADIADSVVQQTRPGSIILLHPHYDHTASTRAALPRIIEQLQAQGYRFVTIPELLQVAS